MLVPESALINTPLTRLKVGLALQPGAGWSAAPLRESGLLYRVLSHVIQTMSLQIYLVARTRNQEAGRQSGRQKAVRRQSGGRQEALEWTGLPAAVYQRVTGGALCRTDRRNRTPPPPVRAALLTRQFKLFQSNINSVSQSPATGSAVSQNYVESTQSSQQCQLVRPVHFLNQLPF